MLHGPETSTPTQRACNCTAKGLTAVSCLKTLPGNHPGNHPGLTSTPAHQHSQCTAPARVRATLGACACTQMRHSLPVMLQALPQMLKEPRSMLQVHAGCLGGPDLIHQGLRARHALGRLQQHTQEHWQLSDHSWQETQAPSRVDTPLTRHPPPRVPLGSTAAHIVQYRPYPCTQYM